MTIADSSILAPAVPFDDVRAAASPEQKVFKDVVFPLVLVPAAEKSVPEWTAWLTANKESLEKLVLRHGAILFRGFPTRTASDFNDFIAGFQYPELPYVGGAAPRTKVVGTVFTANESPAHLFIPFHHEMAQVPEFPLTLFFYCDVEPLDGGETPICLSNVAYERIRAKYPEFVDTAQEKGVRYTRVLGKGDDKESAIGRGWQSTFLTTDPAVAEQRCRDLGNEFEWLADGGMKTISKVLSPTRLDARTGKLQWFNSIVAAYTGWKDARNTPETAVTYGDGKPLPGEAVIDTLNIMNDIAVDLKWKQGDVILVDNRTVMHARRAFAGPRRILASLHK